MISFQNRCHLFPENAIKRAELIYQQRSAQKLRPFVRILIELVIALALIHIGGLFMASLTKREPTPITHSLGVLSALLQITALGGSFYLTVQTIALTANSIARERQAQTWDILVLTGVNAREIVRGKWWATVQYQFLGYLLFSLIRIGATAAYVISLVSNQRAVSGWGYFQLPHPLTVLIAIILSVLFSFANLGLSAACGVMAAAVSLRSTLAILRAIGLQLMMTVLPALYLSLMFVPYTSYFKPSASETLFQSISGGITSMVDNGFNITAQFLAPTYQRYWAEPYASIRLDWILAVLMSLMIYVLLIRFALWRAERRSVRALATPVDYPQVLSRHEA